MSATKRKLHVYKTEFAPPRQRPYTAPRWKRWTKLLPPMRLHVLPISQVRFPAQVVADTPTRSAFLDNRRCQWAKAGGARAHVRN